MQCKKIYWILFFMEKTMKDVINLIITIFFDLM
jgi:hypothetical protein